MTIDVTVRSAAKKDQRIIRRMVRSAHLDPTNLHWSHFVIAEHDDEIIGIGQIRPFRRCPELGSLVVKPEYRCQGIGGMLINALLEQTPPPIYLECRDHIAPYYERFGFEMIRWQDAPMPLKAKAGLGNIFYMLGIRVVVMVYR